jgi:hypothetical protein
MEITLVVIGIFSGFISGATFRSARDSGISFFKRLLITALVFVVSFVALGETAKYLGFAVPC